MMPETGTKEDFKKAVMRHLPARKLVGYWVRDAQGSLSGFRLDAKDAIELSMQWTRQYNQVFNINPEWRSPLLNGS